MIGLDGKIKRLWPLIVCALIAMAAYFQAAGITQLVAATIISGPVAAPAVVAPARGGTKPPKSAAPILSRNAFDSITGPLDGQATPMPEAPQPVAVEAGELSDQAPKCEFGRVVLISATTDPEWSFASIQDTEGITKLRRRGDVVSGHTVQAFAWDRVWLQEGSKECQMKLGDRSSTKAKKPRSKPGRKRRRRRRGSRISPELAKKIHRVSDTEFNVERSVVDEILQNQAQLMRSARIVPERKGDKIVGIRLFGIRSGSLLSTLGLKNGDRLETINGFEMSDPQKALEAYGRLRTADNLKVRVNRKGRPVTIEFNIQ